MRKWHLMGGGCIVFLMIFFSCIGIKERATSKTIKVGKGEMGIEAIVKEGPPIRADQVLTKDHPPYARGMVCVECHKVVFDAVTTSTKQFLLNFPSLPKDKIWKKIEEFLPGRERFVLATSYKGEPTATTMDMVLDREDKVLYAICEIGTEKLFHIMENPIVSAVHYEGWTLAHDGPKRWRSVQIKAKAELITPEDPNFFEYLDRYHLARLTKERAKRRMYIVKLIPLKIIYFDTDLSKQNYSCYQLWER